MEFNVITKDQLKDKLDRGDHMHLVDVRPYSLYWQGHVRGAMNIPFDEMNDRAREKLGPNKVIILYGEDDADVLAKRAADLLIARKFDAAQIAIFAEGFRGWRGAGYFVASGDDV